ncbi:hypothetical protein [Streptomyces sp. NPDC093707]
MLQASATVDQFNGNPTVITSIAAAPTGDVWLSYSDYGLVRRVAANGARA